MKKTIKWICLLLAVLICLSGCAPEAAPKTARSGYQYLTDCVGREVEVPLEPQRVAALDSFAGEAMVMIGAGERMVAAPNGVKSDQLLMQIYPDLDAVAVPMSGGSINAETLAALSTDLVLLKGAMYRTEGEREKLEKLDIPYLVIDYGSMQEQMDALTLIGAALGGAAQEKVQAINNYYGSVIALAQERSTQIPEEARLRVYHSISEIVRTDGTDTLGNDWICCVGAVDVSAGEELEFAEEDYFASPEQIYVWDPDVVICNEADTADYVRTEARWAGLKAVRNKQVYNIPVGATRWGHRGSMETFFAMLWLGCTIYPEIYADIDLQAEVTAFYRDILGLEIDEATYEAMLAGQGIRGKSTGGIS